MTGRPRKREAKCTMRSPSPNRSSEICRNCSWGETSCARVCTGVRATGTAPFQWRPSALAEPAAARSAASAREPRNVVVMARELSNAGRPARAPSAELDRCHPRDGCRRSEPETTLAHRERGGRGLDTSSLGGCTTAAWTRLKVWASVSPQILDAVEDPYPSRPGSTSWQACWRCAECRHRSTTSWRRTRAGLGLRHA